MNEWFMFFAGLLLGFCSAILIFGLYTLHYVKKKMVTPKGIISEAMGFLEKMGVTDDEFEAEMKGKNESQKNDKGQD